MSRRATSILLLAIGFLILTVVLQRMSDGQGEQDGGDSQDNVSDNIHGARNALSSIELEIDSTPTYAGQVTEECPKKRTPDELRAHAIEQQAHFIEVGRELSKSDDADYVLASALLLQLELGDLSMDLFARAHRLAPSSPLVAWNMLRVCRDKEIFDCDLARIEANAVRTDGDNGAMWMELAMLRLAEDRFDEASRMVRQAIAAPRFNTYFIEHALLIERALLTGGSSTYTERMIAGIGFSAALVVSNYAITKHCRAVSAMDIVWIDLCQQIGEKMFVDGRILLDRAIGSSLLKIAAEQSGNPDRIETSIRRDAEFRKHYTESVVNVETQNLLANDEFVLRQYVENLEILGELEAITRLADEAARLRDTDGYDQCNFVNSLVQP